MECLKCYFCTSGLFIFFFLVNFKNPFSHVSIFYEISDKPFSDKLLFSGFDLLSYFHVPQHFLVALSLVIHFFLGANRLTHRQNACKDNNLKLCNLSEYLYLSKKQNLKMQEGKITSRST